MSYPTGEKEEIMIEEMTGETGEMIEEAAETEEITEVVAVETEEVAAEEEDNMAI